MNPASISFVDLGLFGVMLGCIGRSEGLSRAGGWLILEAHRLTDCGPGRVLPPHWHQAVQRELSTLSSAV